MSETPQTATVHQISKYSPKALRDCTSLGEMFDTMQFRHRVEQALPKDQTVDRMITAFIFAARRTQNILKCDPMHAIQQFFGLSYLGLVPGTIQQHAHLVPFRKGKDKYELQTIIGYPGYIDLAYRSGMIEDMQTGLYLPEDEFTVLQGTRREIIHRPNLTVDQSDNSKFQPICGYIIVNMKSGGQVTEVMPWPDVLNIRDRSQAYQFAKRVKDAAINNGERIPLTWTEAPWVRDERQMGRKTLVRRIATMIPKSTELMAGSAWEQQNDREENRIDLGPVIDGSWTRDDFMSAGGLPEADAPVDPGTAFGDRRPPDQSGPATDGDPGRDTGPATRTRTKRQTRQREPEQPVFNQVLVDENGEIRGEYKDRKVFVLALRDLLRECDPDLIPDIFAANEDAISDARQDADVAKMIDQIEQEATTEEEEPEERAAQQDVELRVGVPMVRGRQSWSEYVKAIRIGIGLVKSASLLRWTEAQRLTLSSCPQQTRLLAVRAVLHAYQTHRVSPPSWLSDLIVGGEPEPEAPKPEAQADDKDRKWANARLADLAGIPDDESGFSQFYALANNTSIQNTMTRLNRENKPLWQEVVAAFDAKEKKMKARRPRTEDPPPNDDEDDQGEVE